MNVYAEHVKYNPNIHQLHKQRR